MGVGGLGQEQGGQGHVDVGAVEVEAVAGGHHQADDRLARPQPLQLLDQLGQGAFRRAGAQHDQQLLADIGQELQDREAAGPGDRPQHHQHEQDGGDVEGGHQRAQLDQAGHAVLADGEAHGPERAQRGQLDHHVDDAEEQLGQVAHPGGHPVAELTQAGAGKPRQHGDHQHLQEVALGEGPEEGVGDQVQQIIDKLLAVMGLVQVAGGDLGIQRGGIDVEAMARLQDVADQQADQQGQGRDHLEIEQGLQAHPAERLDVAHVGDAAGHGQEDHRGDHQLDQLDERIAQRLQRHPHVGPKRPDQNPQGDADQHLDIQRLQRPKKTHSIPLVVLFVPGVRTPGNLRYGPGARATRPGSSAG